MAMIVVLVLFSVVLCFVCNAQNPTKCVYTFVTESAICSDVALLQEISKEFRPTWKQIQVANTPGYFSLMGIIFAKRMRGTYDILMNLSF